MGPGTLPPSRVKTWLATEPPRPRLEGHPGVVVVCVCGVERGGEGERTGEGGWVVWCGVVWCGVVCVWGRWGREGQREGGGADLSVHGKSLSMNHDDATNSGGRTPGSKLPATSPPVEPSTTKNSSSSEGSKTDPWLSSPEEREKCRISLQKSHPRRHKSCSLKQCSDFQVRTKPGELTSGSGFTVTWKRKQFFQKHP